MIPAEFEFKAFTLDRVTARIKAGSITDRKTDLIIMQRDSSISIPSDHEFVEILHQHRNQWPHDGYFNTSQRFVETYRLLSNFYVGGRIVDVGGWPGDFACILAALKFDVTLVDKDITRPTGKALNPETGEWALNQSITLVDICHY